MISATLWETLSFEVKINWVLSFSWVLHTGGKVLPKVDFFLEFYFFSGWCKKRPRLPSFPAIENFNIHGFVKLQNKIFFKIRVLGCWTWFLVARLTQTLTRLNTRDVKGWLKTQRNQENRRETYFCVHVRRKERSGKNGSNNATFVGKKSFSALGHGMVY